MGGLLSYMLQVSVVMTLLYLGYKWLMSGTTFHAFNRGALLGILIVSWLLPAFIPLFAPKSVIDVEIGFPVMIASVQEVGDSAPRGILWQTIVSGLYAFGCLVALVVTMGSLYRVLRIIRTGKPMEGMEHRTVVSSAAPGPFSWGGIIVVRPQDCDSDLPLVLKHEQAHLQRLHWIDLMLAQISILFQWYSPAAYLLMHELKCVHEFQADAAAGEGDARKYQMMLLKKTVGPGFPTFADSLNPGSLKQRLTMMMKRNSNSSRRLAALALPAMAALSVFTLSVPSVATVLSDLRSAPEPEIFESKVTKTPAPVQTEAVAQADATVTEEAVEAVDETPVTVDLNLFPAEEAATESRQSPAYFVEGKLFTGSLSEINPADIKSMTIVKDDPDYPQGVIMIELAKEGDTKERPADAVEKIAEYKGGMSALTEFLTSELRVPESVKADETPKRVVVQFVIDTDGSVSDAKIMRGAGEELDNEAKRVVLLTSGRWIPAESNGKPIKTHFVVPITFKGK